MRSLLFSIVSLLLVSLAGCGGGKPVAKKIKAAPPKSAKVLKKSVSGDKRPPTPKSAQSKNSQPKSPEPESAQPPASAPVKVPAPTEAGPPAAEPIKSPASSSPNGFDPSQALP